MKLLSKSIAALLCALLCSTAWAAAPTNDNGINIKFDVNQDAFSTGTTYGLYAADGENWTATGEGTTLTSADIELKTGAKLSFSSFARWNNGGCFLLDRALDDSGAISVTVSGLDTTTFATYSVLIYMNGNTTPSGDKHFLAPTVNGKQYTYGGEGTANWGNVTYKNNLAPNQNCLLVSGLAASEGDNSLTISTSSVANSDEARANGRACLSAIQIVPGVINDDALTFDLTDKGATEIDFNEVAPTASIFCDINVTLADGATLAFDESCGSYASLAVTCDGSATLKNLEAVNSLSIDDVTVSLDIGGAVVAKAVAIPGNVTLKVTALSSPPSGAGTWEIAMPAATTEETLSFQPSSNVTLSQGTLVIDTTDRLTNAKTVTVTGASSTLKVTENDPMNNAGKLVLANGATIDSQKHFRLPENTTIKGTGSTFTVSGVNDTNWRAVSLRNITLEENATATFTRSEDKASAKDAGYHLWNTVIDAGDGSVMTIEAPLMIGVEGDWGPTTTETSLTKSGAGEVILVAPEADTGFTIPDGRPITVSAGTLTLAPEGGVCDLGGATISVASGAVLKVDTTSSSGVTTTIDNSISGEGSLLITGGGTVDIGTSRVGIATDVEHGGTLAFTLTDAEVNDRRAVFGPAESVPTGLTVVATGVPEGEEWSFKVQAGELCYAAANTSRTWVTPKEGSNWSDGLPGFEMGDNVALEGNAAEEAVTLTEPVRVGELSVSGNYAISGAALTAGSVTVATGGVFTMHYPKPVKYLRLTPSGAVGNENNATPGIAELKLYRAGEVVAWPSGTTIVQKNANGETGPEWSAGGNEKLNALIDGVYSGTSKKWTNPSDGSTGEYSAEAQYNKWWPYGETNPAAVITLGTEVAFDGYLLWHTDHLPRSPRTWTLEGSTDGTTWFTLDERDLTGSTTEFTTANAAYNGGTPFAITALEVTNGVKVAGALGGTGTIAGDVNFVTDSSLKLSEDEALTIAGTVSGSPTLDLSGVTEGAAAIPVLRYSGELDDWDAPTGYELRQVDGLYWLVKAITPPLTLELGEDAEWLAASWKDSSATPQDVDAALWDATPVETLQTTVTATADATLTLEADREVASLTVADSEYTLTLAGNKLSPTALTVTGPLAASASSLAIPEDAAINGTLTYEVASGEVALPALSGDGTLVKTGAGILKLVDTKACAPELEIQEGELRFDNAAYDKAYTVRAKSGAIVQLGTWTGGLTSSGSNLYLEGGATLKLANGNPAIGSSQWAATIHVEGATAEAPAVIQGSANGGWTDVTGGITGEGYVKINALGDSPFVISGVIAESQDKQVALQVATDKGVTLSGANTYTGGTTVAQNAKLTVANNTALGTGDILVAAGGTLTVNSDNVLDVHGSLGGLGTVTGAVKLHETAALDLSAATADAQLTLSALPELPATGAVTVTVASGATAGAEVLKFASALAEGTTVDSEKFTVSGVEKMKVVLNADRTALVLAKTALDIPAVGNDALAAASQEALSDFALAQKMDTVDSVTGSTKGGEALTAAQIDGALACFAGEGLIEKTGDTALKVSYQFGITAMTLNGTNILVTAKATTAPADPDDAVALVMLVEPTLQYAVVDAEGKVEWKSFAQAEAQADYAKTKFRATGGIEEYVFSVPVESLAGKQIRVTISK